MAKKKDPEQKVEKVASEQKVEKVASVTQNGVVRPKTGTSTGRVWEIADKLSAEAGMATGRGPVMAQAEAEGINPSTAATQYGKWCKFYGIVKPTTTAKAAKVKKEKAAPAEVAVEEVAEDEEDFEEEDEE